MRASLVLTLLVAAVMGGAWLSARPASGDGPSCQTDSPPTIEGVDPLTSKPWSYATVYGCNLFSPAQDCRITFNGVRAYVVEDYCEGATRIIIPIAATSGPVLAVVNGVPSEPFPYTVLPLDVAPEDIAPGMINVGIFVGSDISSIMEQMGDPAESITYSFCFGIRCWYDIRVPVGSEIEKSIQYYTHPDVIWASPVPVPIPAIGELPLPSPAPPEASPPPSALPPTGGEPAEDAGKSDLALAPAGLVLTATGVVLAAARGRTFG